MNFRTVLNNSWTIGLGTGLGALLIGTLLLNVLGIEKPGFQINSTANGSIVTNGQNGGVNIISDEDMQYYSASQLDDFGLPVETTPSGGLQVSNGLSVLLKPYVSNGTTTSFQCTSAALSAYTQVIQLNPNFPFSYFYLGACEVRDNLQEGNANIKTAKNILEITTTIAGHNSAQDALLETIINHSYR